MAGPTLEIADILTRHGDAFLARHRGHLSLGPLKVISALRTCRTASLGGHVARCTDCAHTAISYNSRRNRHCPKCQGAAARRWLADREAFAAHLAPLRKAEWVVYAKRLPSAARKPCWPTCPAPPTASRSPTAT